MAYAKGERRAKWQQQGYFVIPRLLEPREVEQLLGACDHALQQIRSASEQTGHSTTHIRGFVVPEYYRDRSDALARLVGLPSSSRVLALIHDLGRPDEGELELRDVHYFHEPSTRDCDGPWHRDGQGPDYTLEDAHGAVPTLLRFRVALTRDDHLEYVPGSHARADTDEEAQLRRGTFRNAPLPHGAERIGLEAGDACVFHTWGLHRARYRSTGARRTLDFLFGFGPRPVLDSSGFKQMLRGLAGS